MALKRGLRIYDDLKYNEKFGTLKSLYIKRTKRFVQTKQINSQIYCHGNIRITCFNPVP